MLIQRYIFRQLALTFLFTFFVMIAVFWIGMTIQTMRAFGDAWSEFFFKTAPALFIFASPWALLISSSTATTLTYGRLSADNELNAIRTSGVHTNTIIMPGLMFALLITAVSLLLYEEALPRALFSRRNMINESASAALRNPPPGKRILRLGDDIVLSYLDASDGVLKDPVLETMDKGELTGRYQSREARVILESGSLPVLILVDGQFTRFNNKQKTEGSFRGEPYRVVLSLPPPQSQPQNQVDMTFNQLRRWITPPRAGAGNPKALTEYYSRFGQSFASIPLILLAVPLGMWIRKGSRLAGLGVALPPLLGYIVLMFTFQGLGDRGRVDPWVAGLAPSLALSATALAGLFRIYLR